MCKSCCYERLRRCSLVCLIYDFDNFRCETNKFRLYFVSVGVWLVVIEAGIFPHVKRGYYCDDRSISMKFRGDTISTGLMILTIPLVFPVIWMFEAFFYVPVSLKSSRLVESLGAAWVWYKEFLFGCILHLFVVDGLKVLFGELRPHFLDTCRPNAQCTGR